jgi:hypothetical protein
MAMGSNGLGLSLSGAAGGTGGGGGIGINAYDYNLSATTNITSGIVSFDQAAAGDMSFILSGNTIVGWLPGGYVAGTDSSKFAGSGTTFGGTNISGSMTLNSAGLALSLSAAAGGGGGDITDNFWMPYPSGDNSTFLAMGQNSVYLQGLHVGNPVAVSNVEFMMLHSYVSSNNSAQVALTLRYGMYSYGTGASVSSLMLVASSSLSMQASYNNSSAAGFTIGNSAGSYTISSNNQTNLYANTLSGPKYMYLPFTTTMAADVEYFWAMHYSSASTGQTGPMRLNQYIQTIMNSTVWGELKYNTVVASATNQWEEYDGIVYSATSAGLPAEMASSQLRPMVSKARMHMIFENE